VALPDESDRGGLESSLYKIVKDVADTSEWGWRAIGDGYRMRDGVGE
jgi:hypothetical protein